MKTQIDYLEEKMRLSFGDDLKPLRGFFVISKEEEKKQLKEIYIAGFMFGMGIQQIGGDFDIEEQFEKLYNKDYVDKK